MPGFYDLYVTLIAINTAMALALALYGWQHRHTPGAKTFFWWMICVFVWTASVGLGAVSSTEAMAEFWNIRVKISSVGFTAAAWVLFAFAYIGQHKRLTPRFIGPLLIFPVLNLVVIWSPLSDLMFRNISFVHIDSYLFTDWDSGPWFWIHALYSLRPHVSRLDLAALPCGQRLLALPVAHPLAHVRYPDASLRHHAHGVQSRARPTG